jgi:hypothetical protein
VDRHPGRSRAQLRDLIERVQLEIGFAEQNHRLDVGGADERDAALDPAEVESWTAVDHNRESQSRVIRARRLPLPIRQRQAR